MKNQSQLLQSASHTLVKIVISAVSFSGLTAVLFLSGCQEPKIKEFDAANPVESTEVSDAINELLTQDPMQMKVGEFVQRSTTQDIPAGPIFREVAVTGITLIDRVDDPSKPCIELTLVQDVMTFDENHVTKTHETKEIPTAIKRPGVSSCVTVAGGNSSGSSTDSAHPASALKALMVNVHQLIESGLASGQAVVNVDKVRQAATITYHNLTKNDDIVDPPTEVQRQPNCLGLPSCKIRTRTISYDTINWYDEKSGERVHWEHVVSPDVPFLSGEMSTCATLMVNVPEGKTLLKQCDVVVNFLFETPKNPNQKPSPGPSPKR